MRHSEDCRFGSRASGSSPGSACQSQLEGDRTPSSRGSPSSTFWRAFYLHADLRTPRHTATWSQSGTST
eukprot:1887173-Alexandrium_andersonii.AAC.1